MMRELLMSEFGQSLEELKQQDSRRKRQLHYQFNGIHRFIVEDQLALNLSKQKIKYVKKPNELLMR